jgi:hypothetical protein
LPALPPLKPTEFPQRIHVRRVAPSVARLPPL